MRQEKSGSSHLDPLPHPTGERKVSTRDHGCIVKVRPAFFEAVWKV
jgi:hypothetical protein